MRRTRIALLAALILLTGALLAVQPAEPVITVADCLLQSGYSTSVPDTPVTALAGVNAWRDGLGERVLLGGAVIGFVNVTDGAGARRMIDFYAYDGGIYVFIYKHPADPARRLPGEAAGVHHGDCLLRVVGL